MHDPAHTSEQQQPNTLFRETLGLNRTAALIVAIPGLLLFVGIFSISAYFAICKYWPGVNNGLAILLAALFPFVALAVIIGGCTLSEMAQIKSGNDRAKQFSTGVAILVVLGIACRILGLF